ncbi:MULTISPECIES: hypothetical protein [unclassified Rhodococcus (in: high G+C Gram-positive bacteria)]|uniref:hypothetical protein n=1 Tax=unclassified Rhodococcus (in: high G+C Gram-positive bacteria) TaxID=192944 RepID=UPI0011799F2B|nr:MULTISPECIES: hypothetical protein [unclassified Rhodococcus (in: high G+C Gram-positive bacteria)]
MGAGDDPGVALPRAGARLGFDRRDISGSAGCLDMLMHTTNGRYLSILDAARISYLTRTGLWRWCGIKMTCKPRCA